MWLFCVFTYCINFFKQNPQIICLFHILHHFSVNCPLNWTKVTLSRFPILFQKLAHPSISLLWVCFYQSFQNLKKRFLYSLSIELKTFPCMAVNVTFLQKVVFVALLNSFVNNIADNQH